MRHLPYIYSGKDFTDERCAASVSGHWRSRQCQRKPVGVFDTLPEGVSEGRAQGLLGKGYCKQHDPFRVLVAERDARIAREARRNADQRREEAAQAMVDRVNSIVPGGEAHIYRTYSFTGSATTYGDRVVVDNKTLQTLLDAYEKGNV